MPAVSVELKMNRELKEALDRILDDLQARLSEIERVLVEICDREGIAFNVEQPERERVLRNVKSEGLLGELLDQKSES